MRQANERTVPIRMMALAVVLAAAFGTNDVYAQKGRDGPSYTLRVLGLPTGFVSARSVSINDRHEIVGTVRVALTDGHSRAAYWAHAGAAPVLLPCLSEPCESRATAINNLGVISGTANSQAVLWHPSGTSWIPEVLLNPDPRDETSWAMASDVLGDGTAGGFYHPTTRPFGPTDVPVIWGASEAVTKLPVPEGFVAGSVRRMNESRDAVGVLRTYNVPDPNYIYGALWINDGGTYVTVPLTYYVNDLTPRAADGSTFLVASDAGRVRVWKDVDAWNYVVEANPGGSGTAINAAGDMVGFMVKGGWQANGETPYLLTAGGALTKLPLPSRATGIAADVSSDRWVAGWLYLRSEHPAAVWAPVN